MIVDASALVAIVLREDGWKRLLAALDAAEEVAIGAPTLTETAIVLEAKGVAPTVLPAVLDAAGIAVLPYTHDHARLAAQAFRRFGRGRHPASLNFGDCISYAVADAASAPLLYVGDDFARTDVRTATTD